MLRLPALTLTEPASPEEKVEVLIYPPLKIEMFPLTATSTLPPLPVEPKAALPIPAVEPWPSMIRLPALTFTDPASPEDEVEESILPAPNSETCSVATTSTLPPLPAVP
ncbi:MAG: hypothetical protein AW06_000055 [Candidatus Accumulibacter cognatus]|uniref:Uncharacterized protein n=1 Tax=Candidatus Accumulibacter cognatus TaxID=2954383 RepID=A0A080MBB9_9PROT|nr:MAG: hypothetical protein AW06_000055 [Candidatus Accumulibacter cognatus]